MRLMVRQAHHEEIHIEVVARQTPGLGPKRSANEGPPLGITKWGNSPISPQTARNFLRPAARKDPPRALEGFEVRLDDEIPLRTGHRAMGANARIPTLIVAVADVVIG